MKNSLPMLSLFCITLQAMDNKPKFVSFSDLLNQKDRNGNTVLHITIEHEKKLSERDDESVEKERKLIGETLANLLVIITQKEDIDAVNSENKTPLYMATLYQAPYLVEKLLGRGADPDKKGCDDKTPLELACTLPNAEIVKLLLVRSSYKGTVNSLFMRRNPSDPLPLHTIAQSSLATFHAITTEFRRADGDRYMNAFNELQQEKATTH
jgi:ankyrin repeat protein